MRLAVSDGTHGFIEVYETKEEVLKRLTDILDEQVCRIDISKSLERGYAEAINQNDYMQRREQRGERIDLLNVRNEKESEYIQYAIGVVDLNLKQKLNNGIDKYNYEQTRTAVLWNLEVKDYLISLLPDDEKKKLPDGMFIKDEQDVKRRLGLE